MRHILALIPARGGSKGIPHKNIRPIAGLPLLAYSLWHCQQTPAITRKVVSTDDPKIAAVAEQYGGEVIWRPDTLSGDTASSESALSHALGVLAEREAYRPDVVVFLQATSPLRAPDTLTRALAQFDSEGADSLLSVSPFHGFLWRVEPGGVRSFNYDYQHRPRRQDAPEDVMENGSFYIFRPWVLEKFQNRLGGKIAVYRMGALESFQVDEPEDLILMEALLSFSQRAGQ
jgi:N-acylneuraminate cytidylyltransferase